MCSCIAQLELSGFCVNVEFHQCTKDFFFSFPKDFFLEDSKDWQCLSQHKTTHDQGAHAIRVAVWQNTEKQLKNVDTNSIA